MKCVVVKFVLWLLLPEQEHCAAVANVLIQTTTNEPYFLKNVITRDGSWVYGYDLEMKAQLSQRKSPGSPGPKKVQQSLSKIKTMSTVFFYREDVVHHEYIPPGQTINKECYLNVIHLLKDAIWWKQPHLWANGDWKLHHNNTPAHESRLMQSFCKTLNHPGDWAPLQPSCGALLLLAFPKSKITFEKEGISENRFRKIW